MDDGEHDEPTARNILEGIGWLVEGAQAGDALFMHCVCLSLFSHS